MIAGADQYAPSGPDPLPSANVGEDTDNVGEDTELLGRVLTPKCPGQI
jgi:hypothetical protein